MLLPIEWLKQFVTVNESAEQVAERFVLLGFECELHDDDVIDLEITPNRGDVLSILGLAREYAASTEQSVIFPKLQKIEQADGLPGITLDTDPKAYHALSAVIVDDVTIKASPEWMQRRLQQAGMNCINNLVDLTNYVMVELGIPLHAFDLDKIVDPVLKIRLSQEGEQFVSLKDESVKLPENSIVVENNNELIDLLGIRGGKSSMISESTKRTLIWAVSVPRPLIRKTSKILNLRTDGSYRHERETDWDMVPLAIERIVELARETIGGATSQQIVLNAENRATKQISLPAKLTGEVLGLEVNKSTSDNALTRLGFTVEGDKVTVPSWRYFDINFPEDLTEEVARLIGYNNLPRTVIEKSTKPTDSEYSKSEAIKDTLINQGWTEVYTESFTGKFDNVGLSIEASQLATLANPVNRELAHCRPSLIPNLVKILTLNSWSDDAQIFELGHVFPTTDREENYLGLAATGKKAELLKPYVDATHIQLITPDHPLGKQLKLRKPVTVAEFPVANWHLPVEDAYAVPSGKPSYTPISVYPPAVRDISIITDTDITSRQVADAIKAMSPDNILMVELFDQFQSDKFGENKQSLAFHIIYQSKDGTLDTETVEQIQQRVVAMLENDMKATIR